MIYLLFLISVIEYIAAKVSIFLPNK